ncbi:hypothetical protein [Peristeroidobacter soli]|uniref:hypothetical protein n=1 Tax=Peristeroidobacter soli TaxID=2497877 RepID=UPI00101DC377|nr:hypothetical protein [Peristeroidobacter soli]
MPFRDLRRHLANIHRILDRVQPSRSGQDGTAIATGLSQSLSSLAKAARVQGLTTYCSLSLHVLEQLASARRTGYLPVDTRAVLHDWMRLSWTYLIAPANPAHAAELIEHMGSRRWERPVCHIQRQALLESLKMEALQLALLHKGYARPSALHSMCQS